MPSNPNYSTFLIKMTVKPCFQEPLSPLALQVCTSPCRETSLCFSPHDSRGFSLKHSAPPGRCHLPRPLACPSRASTRQADSLPPGCPDAGSARVQHTVCTLGTNKSGGPSAVLLAHRSHGRQHAPLRDAVWAQLRLAALHRTDCAFLLRDFKNFWH